MTRPHCCRIINNLITRPRCCRILLAIPHIAPHFAAHIDPHIAPHIAPHFAAHIDPHMAPTLLDTLLPTLLPCAHRAIECEEVFDDVVVRQDRMSDGQVEEPFQGSPSHLNELTVRCNIITKYYYRILQTHHARTNTRTAVSIQVRCVGGAQVWRS